MKNAQIAKTFTGSSLIRYAAPTIFMMIFMSAYTIIDGIFVSNFCDEYALAAINIVAPIFWLIFALGTMLAMGSSAVVGKLLGRRDDLQAKQFFTLIYIIAIAVGVFMTGLTFLFFDEITNFLGGNEKLIDYTKIYLLYLAPFMVMEFLQVLAQTFFITAGRPMYGFISCLLGGIANIVFDYLLIVTFDMGLAGAAIATGIGFCIPGIFGLVYFTFSKESLLHFVKPRWCFRTFFQSLYNGLSEFTNAIAAGITTLLFNMILLRMAGESGVAAITVILYIQMFQMAVYMGYSFGVSPVISFKYGEKNHEQLQTIMKISILFLAVVSVITILLSLVFAKTAVAIFIPPTSPTFSMTVAGLRIFSIAYLFMGFNIFTSAMFTALSNGKVSTIISVSRSLVFIVVSLLVLPLYMGINGVWFAVPLAEVLTIILSIYFYKKHQTKYKY